MLGGKAKSQCANVPVYWTIYRFTWDFSKAVWGMMFHIMYTSLTGAEDVLQTPVTTTDLTIWPGSFITPCSSQQELTFQMNSSHHLSVAYLLSIRAGKGTTPHIHCDTNFTPTQGHWDAAQGKTGGCQRQKKKKKAAPKHVAMALGIKMWYSRRLLEVVFSLASYRRWRNWIHQTKTLWNNRDSIKYVKCN